jgi:hypothetical protein
MRRILLLALAILVLAALVWLPLPVPTGTDFQVLYRVDLSLLHGVSLYDHAGQVRLIAALLGVPEGSVNVLPYPYPPWYALAALPLGLLSAGLAARIWFLANLMMVMAAIGFLTDGWPTRRRLPSLLLGFLFLPVLGNVWVGQYGAPVLLGAGMLAYGLRKERVLLTALGCALLTFKPHIGTLILLTVLVYLLARRDRFCRRSLWLILSIGLLLFAIGFVASPIWPVDYYHSLTSFKGVSECNQCTSLPIALASAFSGGFDQAILISAGLLGLCIAWLLAERHRLAANPQWLVTAAAFGNLVVSPYLQNYDYILLVIPLLTVADQAQGLDWLWLGLAYILPFAGLSISTLQPDLTFVGSTLILFALFVRMIHKRQAIPPSAAEQVAG